MDTIERKPSKLVVIGHTASCQTNVNLLEGIFVHYIVKCPDSMHGVDSDHCNVNQSNIRSD